MTFIYILAAIFIFGVLIALHEFGHFAAAKLCGVRVNEFSIGMGPLLWQKQTEETQYSLRLLPIGGFCALDEDQPQSAGDERSFVRQSFWKKFVILAAGSFMNFLTGLVVLLFLYAGASGFYLDQIAGFAEGFPLEGENGLMVGDVFYKIDGYRTYLRGDASLFLQYNDGKGIDIEVIRNGEKVVLKDFPMYRDTYDGQPGRFGLSVGSAKVPADFLTRLQYTWYQALDFVQLVWFSLVQLVTGNAGMQDLSGPVGIVSTITEVGEASETVRVAVENISYFAALIAVNLAVMNLLPIPALDGGRIFFLVVDAISMLLFRRKVPEKYQAAVNMVGFAVLMGFMLIVTVQDVFKLFQ